MHEGHFKEWAKAYRRWHSKDFKSWREHQLRTIPALEGVALGTLSEDEVEKLRPWLEKAHQVAITMVKKEGQRTSKELDFLNDVSCVRYAITHLEDWLKNGNAQIPMQKDLGIDANSNAGTSDKIRDIEAKALVRNGDFTLLDPEFEHRAETFLAECVSVRKKLAKAETLADAHLGAKYAEVLTSAARAIGLGKEIQLQAEALQYHGYWRMRELIEKGKEEGTIRSKGSVYLDDSDKPKKLTDLGLTKSDLNHIGLLAHFSEGQFKELLQEGVESKKLSWQIFKNPPDDNKLNCPSSGDLNTSQQSVIKRDPVRFTVQWAADMRTNPTFYDDLDRFAKDPRVIENLTPVAERAYKFWSLLCDKLGNTAV
jgi:hypothetical protein